MATEPERADSEILVVSLNEFARELWHARQVGILRRQSIAAIVLGAVWLGMIVLPVGWAVLAPGGHVEWWAWPLLAALLMIPLWLVAQGVTFLRRPPHLQELQLTVTEDEVIIPEHLRLSVVDRHRPEVRWRRDDVQAALVPAKGLMEERLRLKPADSRRWARYWGTRYLDVPAQSIVDAVARR